MFATIMIQPRNVMGNVSEHALSACLLGLVLLLALVSIHLVTLLVAVHAATSFSDKAIVAEKFGGGPPGEAGIWFFALAGTALLKPQFDVNDALLCC